MGSLLEQRVDALASDEPKLDAALKNLLSFVLAEAESSSGGAPARLEEAARSAQAAARSASLAINAAQIPTAPQWGLEHPQADGESAVDRIESLARYKAAHAMHAKLQQTPGCKTTKYFGRLFLEDTRAWPDMRSEAERNMPDWIKESSDDDQQAKEAFLNFLNDFERGLLCASSSGSTAAGGGDVDEGDERSDKALAEILWSTDMSATLRARMERRAARIEGRNRREEANANDAFTNAVRSAAAGGLIGHP